MTLTDEDGYYFFLDAPSLKAGESYGVFYENDMQVEGRVGFWYCYPFAPYTAGETYPGGDFDIADVALGPPDSSDPQRIPVTFRWTPRALEWAPAELYQVRIWDTVNGAVFSDYSEWTDHFDLTQWPEGFGAGDPCEWIVLIWDWSGYGRSLASHQVVFGP